MDVRKNAKKILEEKPYFLNEFLQMAQSGEITELMRIVVSKKGTTAEILIEEAQLKNLLTLKSSAKKNRSK